MIIYAVTVAIERRIQAEWLTWMRETHVPEVLQTGYFSSCQISHHPLNEDSEREVYTFSYTCKDLADFGKYQRDFAPALQEDHTKRYHGRFRASRAIMEVVDTLHV